MNSFAYEQDQISRFYDVLTRVDYPMFYFMVAASKGCYYMQIECSSYCNVTSEPIRWKTRKWLLSPHMTDGEIVQTAFKAVLAAIEHEAREKFTYRGASIFDPHYDIEKLVELRRQPDALKEREPHDG